MKSTPLTWLKWELWSSKFIKHPCTLNLRFELSDLVLVVICTILHKVAAIFIQIFAGFAGKFKIDEQLDDEARYKGIILKR